MIRPFESELTFIAGAALSIPEAPLERQIPPEIRWDRLMELAARHRVEGLVGASLARSSGQAIPDFVRDHFERRRRVLAFEFLAQSAETLRLGQILEKAGIPVLVLKGCGVAHQLYRPHPELRHSVDIDLLVSPEDFPEANKLLRRAGYKRIAPREDLPASADSMVLYLVSAYEYTHAETGQKVELHHRLLGDPTVMRIPFGELLNASVAIPIGKDSVRGLGGDLLAVHLCAHAAGHAFFRLKWLADCVRALHGLGTDRVAALIARARDWNCEHSVRLAMLLGETLRGAEERHTATAQKARLAHLMNHAIRAITRSEKSGHGLKDIPDDLRAAGYGMRLASSYRSRAFSVLRFLTHPDDAALLGLSRNWAILYALIGRLLALARLVSRSLARPQPSSP